MNPNLKSKTFWLRAAERAGWTFGQSIAGVFTVGATFASVSWQASLSAAGVAAGASLLKSLIVGVPEAAPILEPVLAKAEAAEAVLVAEEQTHGDL